VISVADPNGLLSLLSTAFENRLKRKIFGTKREEGTG
jgi:hypothetical protein